MKNRPILITGAHRSGSTWVGKMIATSPDVVYVSEPFNIYSHHYNLIHTKFVHMFTYIDIENESLYIEPLKKTINLQYDLIALLKKDQKTASEITSEVKNFLYYRIKHFQGKRILFKDPIAIFSAEWLASYFNFQVVILIRHPAAFVGSIVEKGWSHNFQHFLDQPLLMNQHLEAFRPEIEYFAKHPQGIIDQACLLWRIIYYMVNKYRVNHPDWMFIRHEDISRRPTEEFRKLFKYLDLEFSPKIQKIVIDHSWSVSDNDMIMRNSLDNIFTWKQRLSPTEIDYIRENVSDISQYYYSDEDWG